MLAEILQVLTFFRHAGFRNTERLGRYNKISNKLYLACKRTRYNSERLNLDEMYNATIKRLSSRSYGCRLLCGITAAYRRP